MEPFLKWAGNKRQLLDRLSERLPKELKEGKIDRYVEPFLGSGAMFFDIVGKYGIKAYILNDANVNLILLYKTIRSDVEELIEILEEIEAKYLSMDEEERSKYYYETRDVFNKLKDDTLLSQKAWVKRSAQFLFLNRTCFNGLYRVNSQGHFNVPHGDYKNPLICNAELLRQVSKALQEELTVLHCGDFEDCKQWIDRHTFVYLDPPYRPLNKTSSFNQYAGKFDDRDQARLKDFCHTIDVRGGKFLLSNSDTKDGFFESLYEGCEIDRVSVRRNINSKGDSRGSIDELLIRNYALAIDTFSH